MTTAIEGTGRLVRGEKELCRVAYELNIDEGESFTLTDGLLEVLATGGDDGDTVVSLEPYEPYTLILEEALADGRVSLPVRVEPYEGHRPDERYQVQVEEEAP